MINGGLKPKLFCVSAFALVTPLELVGVVVPLRFEPTDVFKFAGI